MADACETFGFRVGYSQDVEETFGVQVGYGVNESFGFRVGYERDVEETFGPKVGYRTPRQDALQRLLANPALLAVILPGGQVVYRHELKRLKYAVKLELVEGDSVTRIPCSDFTITEPMPGAISWTAVLGPENNRWFVPNPSSGPFVGGKHRGSDVNDAGVKRYYRVEIRTADRVWKRDHLIRNDYGWDLDNAKHRGTIMGTDLSEQLVLAKDKKFGIGDYKSTRNQVYTVQQIMAAILGAFGITYRFEFSDLPMAQFTAIGQAMNLLNSLCEMFHLDWFFDNDVFVVREFRYKKNGPGRWRLTDRYQVKKAKFRGTGAGVQTEKVVQKQDQTSNIAAEFDEEQFGILGYNTVTFDPPRSSVTADVLEAFSGSANLFVYQNADGDALVNGTGTGTYRGSAPAHSCRFLYLEDPDDLWPPGRKPKCHVVWYAANPLGLPTEFDQYYTKRGRATPDEITEWGTRREVVQQTPEIAHAWQALRIAQDTVDRSLMSANALNLECVLVPWFERGETIDLVMKAAGWMTSTFWWLDSITRSVKNDRGEMSLQMTRRALPSE